TCPILVSLYTTHQELHSFPTRRSSDLWFSCGSSGGWRPGNEGRRGHRERLPPRIGSVPRRSRRLARWCGPARSHPRPRPVVPVRSEEHTSELQSRENLVCRLQLEKKKT